MDAGLSKKKFEPNLFQTAASFAILLVPAFVVMGFTAHFNIRYGQDFLTHGLIFGLGIIADLVLTAILGFSLVRFIFPD